jgi:hypothetical protein
MFLIKRTSYVTQSEFTKLYLTHQIQSLPITKILINHFAFIKKKAP